MDIGIRAGQLKTVLLLGCLTAAVVGAGSFAAPSYAWAFAFAGVAMNVGMWFFSDRVVLRTSGARLLEPAESPDLHEMVRDVSSRLENAPEVTEVVLLGEPAAELARMSHHADLLVLGAHGHGGAAGVLLGSVVGECLRRTVCPVVVIPPGAVR